jgi:hypothetical protein
VLHVLHPIREIAQFMNWAICILRLRLSCWPLHILVQFMNWPENEQRLAQFVKWARVIWPDHEMGNFTDGV